jgi:hypothetical protein
MPISLRLSPPRYPARMGKCPASRPEVSRDGQLRRSHRASAMYLFSFFSDEIATAKESRLCRESTGGNRVCGFMVEVRHACCIAKIGHPGHLRDIPRITNRNSRSGRCWVQAFGSHQDTGLVHFFVEPHVRREKGLVQTAPASGSSLSALAWAVIMNRIVVLLS